MFSKNEIKTLFNNNIIVYFILTISSISVLLNNFSSILDQLGAQNALIDIIITLIILVSTVQWASVIIKKFKLKINDGIGFHKEEIKESLLNKKERLFHIVILLVLLSFSYISLKRPINLVGKKTWIICGSIKHNCDRSSCFILYDKWKRKINKKCIKTLDDTGYFELSKNSRLEYKPYYLSLFCKKNESELFRIESIF